jgi:hypothetical protein
MFADYFIFSITVYQAFFYDLQEDHLGCDINVATYYTASGKDSKYCTHQGITVQISISARFYVDSAPSGIAVERISLAAEPENLSR